MYDMVENKLKNEDEFKKYEKVSQTKSLLKRIDRTDKL